MLFRLVLTTVVGLFLGAAAAGGWWFMHRRPDPAIHAGQMASLGDMRETLLLQRTAVASDDKSADARLHLAQSLLKVGDGVAAEKSFRSAKDLGADQWTVLPGLGDAELLQNHWQQVLDDVHDAAPDPAIRAKLLLLRGMAQLGLDQLPNATATLRKAEAAAPDQPNTLLLAALVARASGDLVEARAKADAVLAKDPKQIDALLLKLRLTDVRADQAGAMALATRAVEAAPWMIIPRLERANLLMLANEDAKAREDVDVVLSRMPRMATARYLDAVLLARTGRNVEAAAAFERLGAVGEQFPRALYIQSVIASRLGNRETAESFAVRYNNRFPQALDGVLLAAKAHLEAKRPDLAAPLLELAIAAAKAGGHSPDPALYAVLGDAYAGLNRPTAAMQARQQAASLAPGNAAILNGLGLSQLRQGDISAGLDTLAQASDIAAPPPEVSNRLFSAALAIGDLERAEATLSQRRAADGDTVTVRTMAAMLEAGKGDLDGARKSFEALVQASPDAIGAKIGLAKILMAQGHPEEATALLKPILDKDPANPLAFATQLQIWVATKAYEPALRAAEAAQVAAPNDLRFLATRTELMMRAGDAKGALVLLEDRRGTAPLPPFLLSMMAQAQIMTGAPDAALATYASLLVAEPANIEMRLAQVRLLVAQKRPDEAEASLRAGLTVSPGVYGLMRALTDLEVQRAGLDAGLKQAAALRALPDDMPAAAFLRGDLLSNAKQFDAAAQAFQTEFDQAPSAALALRLSQAQAAGGHLDAAATGLRAWSKLHPGDSDVAATLARLDTAAGRWDDATTELEARLQRRPNDPEVLNDLAWIYQSKHDPRALDLAQRAYKIMPAPQIADTLGWIMLQQGDTAPALALLQQASAQRPDDPALTYHVAVAYQKSGRLDDARKTLDGLLARPAPFDDRAAAEKTLLELKAH